MLRQDHELRGLRRSRRPWLRIAVGAMLLGMAASCDLFRTTAPPPPPPLPAPAPEPIPPLTEEARDALTPAEIIAQARAGNARFRTGRKLHRDELMELQLTASGQWPAAVVLGCIDSRAPAEMIFDLGLGDIFNCRVAGNVEGPDVLGSLEFATKVAGAKVVFVLGHSACGAVKGSIEAEELGNLTQLLAKIQPAIAEGACTGERAADDPEFVDAVARKNVELTVRRIREGSPILAELERAGDIEIVGCFYDVSTGQVEFLDWN